MHCLQPFHAVTPPIHRIQVLPDVGLSGCGLMKPTINTVITMHKGGTCLSISYSLKTTRNSPRNANAICQIIWRFWMPKQLSSPNFLYQYFSISLLVFQVLEVAYLDRDAA